MKITNKFNLPAPLVRAVTYDTYSKGASEYSVTGLIKPPQIAVLEKRHADEIEEDASERLWLLLGSAGHEVLRRSADSGIVEERCEVELAGCKISGQLDYAITDRAIIDYKFTSVWAVKEGVKPEWEQQLNAYRYLALNYGVQVDSLYIVAVLRDWSKPESRRNPDYPPCQVKVLNVEMWSPEETETFLTERIRLHKHAEDSGILPACTPDEMWERPAKWAVKKKGNIRASKLYNHQADAEEHARNDPKMEIEFRPPERPRCEDYCAVSQFCTQMREWKQSLQAVNH